MPQSKVFESCRWVQLICLLLRQNDLEYHRQKIAAHRWKRINAIVEAVEHDDSVADAGKAPASDAATVVDYDQLEGVALAQAVAWANQQSCPVTLYIYDAGKGTTSEGHFDAVANRF